jgi:hypothetical protein
MSNKKSNKRHYKKLLLFIIIGVAVVGAGTYGVIKYREYQSNRIFSSGQSMPYPGFKVTVTGITLKPVDVPLNKDVVAKYGGLQTSENCNSLSDQSLPYSSIDQLLVNEGRFVAPYPSPRVLCVRRNDSRKDINTYSAANRQLNVNYLIAAKSAVNTKNIKIQLLPDSGRDLTKGGLFNGNEMTYDNLFYDENGVYNDFQSYTPYFQSDIRGNIDGGLTRNGYIYTDVRNTEKSVDFNLTYTNNGKITTKTTRIYLNGETR